MDDNFDCIFFFVGVGMHLYIWYVRRSCHRQWWRALPNSHLPWFLWNCSRHDYHERNKNRVSCIALLKPRIQRVATPWICPAREGNLLRTCWSVRRLQNAADHCRLARCVSCTSRPSHRAFARYLHYFQGQAEREAQSTVEMRSKNAQSTPLCTHTIFADCLKITTKGFL